MLTDPVEIEVTVAVEQVQATVLQQMLEDTVASYASAFIAHVRPPRCHWLIERTPMLARRGAL